MPRLFRLFVFSLLVLAQQALAWWDSPHMISAQITYDLLTPQARERVDALIARHSSKYPKAADFVTASVWADDLRGEGITTYSSWHYVTLTFKQPADPMPSLESFPDDVQVAWAIRHEQNLLKNPQATEDERALALRRLMHWVADLHQPMHACTHISPNYPKGDSGGNAFLLGLDKPLNNLHSYWDSGLGLWVQSSSRPLTPAGKAWVQSEATRLATLYGHLDPGTDDPYAWAIQSHQWARDYAYTGIEYKGIPSPEYVRKGQALAERQLVMSAIRLARILNEM